MFGVVHFYGFFRNSARVGGSTALLGRGKDGLLAPSHPTLPQEWPQELRQNPLCGHRPHLPYLDTRNDVWPTRKKNHPGSYLWQWDWGWESITARDKGINSPNRHFGISLSTEIFAMKERAVWTLLGSPGFDWCPQDFALEEDSWSLFTLFLALRILENCVLSQNEGFSCGSVVPAVLADTLENNLENSGLSKSSDSLLNFLPFFCISRRKGT